MPHQRRNHGTLGILALLATIIFLVVFGEIIAHLYVFVLLAFIPIAYLSGGARERMKQQARADMLRANAEYDYTANPEAVSPYPCDTDTTEIIPRGYVEPVTEIQTRRLSRDDILRDPRSGVRRLEP